MHSIRKVANSNLTFMNKHLRSSDSLAGIIYFCYQTLRLGAKLIFYGILNENHS